MQLSLINVISLYAQNGILLNAAHRVIGERAKDADYSLSQTDVDALGRELDTLHAKAGRLLTPEADDTTFDGLFGEPGQITQQDRVDRHSAECRALYAAEDHLRALYKVAGLYAPTSWID